MRDITLYHRNLPDPVTASRYDLFMKSFKSFPRRRGFVRSILCARRNKRKAMREILSVAFLVILTEAEKRRARHNFRRSLTYGRVDKN